MTRFNVGLFQHYRKCDLDDCDKCEEFKKSDSYKMRMGNKGAV